MRVKLAVVAVAALLFASLSTHTANAATPVSTAPSGISLNPVIQNVSLPSFVSSQQVNVTLTNHNKVVETLNLTTQDFGSLNNTGGILLLNAKSNYGQQYGLVSWLTLGTNTVTLKPGETQTVPVTIDNRLDLQPGGHYAAVVATTDDGPNQTTSKVAITQQILSLLLVDKVGGDHYNLKLNSISQNGNWLHLPSNVLLSFQNPGNVHVVPRGIVKLKGPSGTVVATGIINSDTAYILPDSFRDMYVSLTKIGHSVPLPGLYHLEVDYRYDGITNYAAQTRALKFIDLGLYLLVIVLIIVGLWLGKRQLKKRQNLAADETK